MRCACIAAMVAEWPFRVVLHVPVPRRDWPAVSRHASRGAFASLMTARSSSNPKHHPQQGSTAVRSQGWAARRALVRLLLICASFMLKALSSCLLSANAGSSFLLWGRKYAISQGVRLAVIAPLLSIHIFVGCSSGGDIAKRAALRADCPPSDPARPSRISARAHRRF